MTTRGSDDGGITYEEWQCDAYTWSSLQCSDPERRARKHAEKTGCPVYRRMVIESAWVEISNVHP